jgi:hypothetical protein
LDGSIEGIVDGSFEGITDGTLEQQEDFRILNQPPRRCHLKVLEPTANHGFNQTKQGKERGKRK